MRDGLKERPTLCDLGLGGRCLRSTSLVFGICRGEKKFSSTLLNSVFHSCCLVAQSCLSLLEPHGL